MHRAHCFLKDSHRRSKGGHQRLPWWPWQAEWGPHTLLPGGFDGVYAKGRTKTPGFGGIWMGGGGKGERSLLWQTLFWEAKEEYS